MNKIIPLVLLSSLVTVTGCTSLSSKEVTHITQQLKSNKIAVITDACLMQQETEETYIIREQSAYAGAEISRLLTSELNDKGVATSTNISPLSCSFMSPQTMSKYSQRRDVYSVSSPVRLPLVATDEPVQQIYPALQRLNQDVFLHTSMLDGNKPLAVNFRYKSHVLNISNHDINELKTTLGSSKVMLVHLMGYKPATSLKAVGTALTILAMAAGTGTTTGLYTESQHYLITYVDLDTKKILWAKQQKFKGVLFEKSNTSLDVKDMIKDIF